MAVSERMNRAMRRRGSRELPASGLEASLQTLLDAGFVERDGCVFLAAEADSAPVSDQLDQTGREAFVNHIHIEDWLTQRDDAGLDAQAMHYARALAERLDAAFPNHAFDVVLAVGDSSTVRFYRHRSNESPYLSADLESYEDEAMLVLRID